MKKLDKMHQEHLQVNFNDDVDSEQQIEILSSEITKVRVRYRLVLSSIALVDSAFKKKRKIKKLFPSCYDRLKERH